MKTGIHPEYTPTKITCACGRVTETYATVDELHVEICSHCHPFFTGKQKLVDTAGRVERFRRKYRAEDQAPESEQEEEVEAPTAEVAETDQADEVGDADDADDADAGEAEASAESTEA